LLSTVGGGGEGKGRGGVLFYCLENDFAFFVNVLRARGEESGRY
jgi:hypothetical protein